MFSVKKIIFSLLLLPFLFSLGSLITPKQANAQLTTCLNGVFINNPSPIEKQGTQTKYTVKISNSSTTTCTYAPFVSDGANVANWNFSFNSATVQIPANSFKNIIVTAKPPSSWLNNPSNNGFRLRLKLNGTQISGYRDIDYPASYAPNCNAKPSLVLTDTTNGSGFKTYSLNMKNNDGNGCNPTAFRILTTKPTNWTTAVQNSIGGTLSSPVTKGLGGTVNFKVKVTPPNNAATNTNPGYTIKTSVTGDSQSDSVNLIYPISAPSRETFRFSGYIFLDGNSDGKRQASENCYKGNVNVRIGGVGNDNTQKSFASTSSCNLYSISTTTAENKVLFSIRVPSDHTATKLNYEFNHQGDVTVQTANGSSREFNSGSKVNFGIKPNTSVPVACTGGGTWSSCRAKNPDSANGASCGPNSGERSKTLNSGTASCTPKKITENCKPTAASACESGVCTDNKCVAGGGGNTCDKNAPTLDITPNRNGNPGDEKEYDVKVINNDKGNNCDPVDFTLSKERMPGSNWTGSFKDNTLANIPKNGGNKSTKFKVKSPKSATEGPKTITVGVRRQGQSVAQKTVNVTYTVQDNTPVTNTPTNKPADCVKNNPEITVNPESVSLTKGSEATYTVKVKNMDTGTCADRSLSMQRILPTTWTGEWSPAYQFTLAKGAEKTYTLTVKSSTTANLGTYPITINVKNSSNVNISTKNVNYIVTQTNTCQKSEPEFSITPQTKSGNPGVGITYNMTIKNIDQGDCENRTFSLAATPPGSDWSANFAENTSSFAPGESKEISVTITSPSNAPSGEHITVLKLLENNTEISSIVAVYSVQDQITPIPGNTYLNFKLGIDGIGNTPRIPIGGNKNPNNIWRGLNFKIYSTATNTLSFTGTNITFTYNQNSEKFELLYDFPSVENLPNGSYNIYVDGPGFLTNQYPGSFSITQGQVTELTSNNFYLITGNVNNSDLSENRIDLMDYNLLLSCSVYSQDRTACDSGDNNEKYTDLNDDGIVNEDDYTLFLKEFANQQGVILPE